MCTFIFRYPNEDIVKCEHIKSAVYTFSKNRTEVAEEKLMDRMFQLGQMDTIWLFAENQKFCISPKDLRSITIQAE